MLFLQTAPLPPVTVFPEPRELPSKEGDDLQPHRGTETVLIVEDQALMRQTLRDFLQGAFPSCDFREAADGAGALESCKAHRPDLVLMDKCLPDADGIELTARLRILYPGIQVIVVSQTSGEAYVQRALAAGALAYVVKDNLLTELVPAVATAIGIAPDPDMGTWWWKDWPS